MTAHTITVIRLAPDHPAAYRDQRDLCAMHTRVVDATIGMPTDEMRVLHALPHPGLLAIRAPEPVTAARLPAGYATSITHRPWTVPGSTGTWRMAGVVNPGRHSNTGGPTLAQPDRKRVHTQPHLYTTPDEQRQWLGRRLPGATIDEFTIARAWVGHGRHRTGKTITVRCVTVSVLVTVHDPASLAAAVTGGVGMDKTWGCGLTLWEPM